MVVSHTHEYVFVEVPHTASTAISEELCLHYGGIRILYKHARYNEFWESATPAERRYRVFAGVRNPMDDLVSVYLKFKHNHKSNFTKQQTLAENGGWVSPLHMRKFRYITENDASFAEYFLRFHRKPYTNKFLHNRRDYDLILRFEALQEDFGRLLERIGVEQVRPLPAVNPTAGKRDYAAFYTPETRRRAGRVLGPYMRHWGYEFPAEWGRVRVPLESRARYRIHDAVASLAATWLRDRPAVRAALGPVRALVRRALPGGA